MIIRFLRKCQECYFASEEGKRVQRYKCVSLERRIELCKMFDYTCSWEPLGSSRSGEIVMELSEPEKKEPMGVLAEVGGECFFSSVYYLLCGRKSGKFPRNIIKTFSKKSKY